MINKMKVAELQVYLLARGMSKNGLKAVLINLLKTAVAQGVTILQDLPVVEIKNSAGNVFRSGAYWK